jgi:C-terminal processing protease CtpA/Prc
MFEKNLKRFIYVLIAVSLLTMAATKMIKAQGSPEKLLPVEDMLADFDTLHKIVRESHPNPYRGISEAEAEKNWRRVRGQIKKPLTELQFLNLLNPVYSQYNDGHTFLDIPTGSETYKNYKQNGGLFFPFKVWQTKERLFVTEKLGDTDLPRGTEIIEINGEPARKIYRDLVGAMSGDSPENKSATTVRLFSLMYWQRYNPGSEFTLKTRRPNQNKTEIIKAKGITGEQMENAMYGAKAVDAYELSPEIFVLEINKMQSNETVKKFIDDAFAQIKEKNYPALVIDIRRNGGGNSVVANWVFSYLTHKPYRHANVKEIRMSSYLAENYKNFSGWMDELKAAKYPIEGDRIQQKATTAANERDLEDKEKWVYGGKVYLLTAPQTYSSAFMMAETFKCYEFGMMIGEAPGSHRNLTGELWQFKLPKSKIVGYVATSQFFPPCYEKEKTAFLEPDVKIQQTYEDLTASKDTVLEYIKKHSAESKKQTAAK